VLGLVLVLGLVSVLGKNCITKASSALIYKFPISIFLSLGLVIGLVLG
jgi:hypothetical protein